MEVVVVTFGVFTLDGRRRQLLRGSRPIHLSPKAFDLLAVLVEERPAAVSKDRLHRRLWPDSFVSDGSLAVLVAEIRAALGDNVSKPAFVRTLHRFGYAFVAPEGSATAVDTAAGHEPPATNGASPLALTSIAVLPFVFLSDIDDRRALSLGFADAVITIISNLEDVVVAPTSAILRYAAGVEPAVVSRELGVRYTLQGTVQKVGGQWRVSVQLFDAETQKIACSEAHDFRLDDVFDVQDAIGRRAVDFLHKRFPRAARSRDRYSSDPDAYHAFITGLRESFADQRDALVIAAEHLSLAVAHDPAFALAHATLSQVSMNIHLQFDPQRKWLRQAEEHCRLALAIDPELPEGHLARAWILWSPEKNFQHAEAIAALERVLAARPTLERAHNRLATIYLHIGRLADARAAHERALRSNPRTRTGNLEYFYIYTGDYARAEEAADAWYRERPGNVYALTTRIITALLSGRLDLAEERLAIASGLLPDEPLIVVLQGILDARQGRSDRALVSVSRALDSPRSFGHTHHVHHHVACVYALLGDLDRAMVWLERAADTGFPCWPFFRIDPHLASLRADAAFTQLMADLEKKYAAAQ